MTLLLIDGDIIAYKAAASAETPVNWGDGLWTLHSFEQDVAVRLDEQIPPKGKISHTFTQTGEARYFSAFDPEMRATVFVENNLKG